MGRYASPLLGLKVKLATPQVSPPVELGGNVITTLVTVEREFREIVSEMQPMIMCLDRLTHISHSCVVE